MSGRSNSMIHELLDEIDSALSSKLFRVALLAALTVPDIAGALDSSKGTASGKNYERWFDTDAAARFLTFGHQYLTGADCYLYRCALLHQGRPSHHGSRYSKTMFVLPKQSLAHAGVFAIDHDQTAVIDIVGFCQTMTKAARDWLGKVENTALFVTNSAQTMELFHVSFE